MKRKLIRTTLLIGILVTVMLAFPSSVYAITEGEVESAVNTQGREAVAGNIFIWFLCAIAFLKASQKIDSFMSSLGINVGHTGGSMLAEAMIATRAVQSATGGRIGGFGKGGGGGGSGGGDGGGMLGGFMAGGLSGAVGRKISGSAASSVTGGGGVGSGISRAMFNNSLAKGGDFANNVTSSVAKGRVSDAGTMTGDTAIAAFQNYMGVDSSSGASYSDVEIGGGRIIGYESSGGGDPVQFALYSADHYTSPDGDYKTQMAADNSKWYKQYATSAVDRTPYMNDKGSIEYKETIVSKMPQPPHRKDRL